MILSNRNVNLMYHVFVTHDHRVMSGVDLFFSKVRLYLMHIPFFPVINFPNRNHELRCCSDQLKCYVQYDMLDLCNKPFKKTYSLKIDIECKCYQDHM